MPFSTYTLSGLTQSIADRLDASAFWDAEAARLALNETLSLWNLLTGTWRGSLPLPTVANQIEYDLSSTLTFGNRVTFNGVPLIPTSQMELNYGQPDWRSETTATTGVPTVPTLWAPLSLQQIVIWPADALGGQALVVEGVLATPLLLQDGDTVDLGDEWREPFFDETVHLLAFHEAGPRWRATLPLDQGFLQAAAELNGVLKANQRYRQYAGLDRQRDLVRAKGVPNRLQQGAA